jgi:hypothetical protein
MSATATFTHLDALESEAIHVMREVASERTAPVQVMSPTVR